MQEKKPLFQTDEHYWKLKTLIEFNRLTWTIAVAFCKGIIAFRLQFFITEVEVRENFERRISEGRKTGRKLLGQGK